VANPRFDSGAGCAVALQPMALTRELKQDDLADNPKRIDDIELPQSMWYHFLKEAQGSIPEYVLDRLTFNECKAVALHVKVELKSDRPYGYERGTEEVEQIEDGYIAMIEYLKERSQK